MQGVNAALQDVWVLCEAIEKHRGSFEQALEAYNEERAKECVALAEMAAFAAPYQYRQSETGYRLWVLNFVVRLLLNKAAPGVFYPPAIHMLQVKGASYCDVVQKAHATTQRLWAVGATVAASAGVAAALAL